MDSFIDVIARAVNRSHEAEAERQEIKDLFKSLDNAVRSYSQDLVELHFDDKGCPTYEEFQNDFSIKTRIVLRSRGEPSRGTVLARGRCGEDGGYPYQLVINHEFVYCLDLQSLERRLRELLGSAVAGRAMRELMGAPRNAA